VPFNIPDVVNVEQAGRWWRLKPARLDRAGKLFLHQGHPLTPQQWTSLGRLVAGPPRDLHARSEPTEASPLLQGDASRRIVHPGHWDPVSWHQVLAHLDLREEWYTFQGYSFDVRCAKFLATRAHLSVQHKQPDESWWAAGRALIQVDPARLPRVDMTKPVLFGTLADRQGLFQWLIDGNHRATRGLHEKVSVPYVVLPPHLTVQTVPRSGTRRKAYLTLCHWARYHTRESEGSMAPSPRTAVRAHRMKRREVEAALRFYQDHLEQLGYTPRRSDPEALTRHEADTCMHARSLCEDGLRRLVRGQQAEACRCLGWIQALLWAEGSFSLRELAVHVYPEPNLPEA